jgi:hypothetical protein
MASTVCILALRGKGELIRSREETERSRGEKEKRRKGVEEKGSIGVEYEARCHFQA